MRNIQARFKQQESKNESSGAFGNLVRAVRGQKFSRQNLIKTFKKVMPEEEYAKDETKGLIDFLEIATNSPEESEILGKNDPEGSLNSKDGKQFI